MPMSGKKDRDRFSIKFNLNDPLHEAAVRLLEQQGPRRKAQFIANAVLHYVNCPERPEFEFGQPVDHSYVETMVLEILQQQGLKERVPVTVPDVDMVPIGAMSRVKKEAAAEQTEVRAGDEELTVSKDIDEITRALIADTMTSFRNN